MGTGKVIHFIIISLLITGCGVTPSESKADLSYEQTTENGNAVFTDYQGIEYIIRKTDDEFSVIANHYVSDHIFVKECTVTVNFGIFNQEGNDSLQIEIPAKYTSTATQQNAFANLSYTEANQQAHPEILSVPDDVNDETLSTLDEENLKQIADEIIARKSEFEKSFKNK